MGKRSRQTESSDEDKETGVGCQTETTETVSTFCQTDRELAELTVLQIKEFNELKKENAMLSKEIPELKYRKETQFCSWVFKEGRECKHFEVLYK